MLMEGRGEEELGHQRYAGLGSSAELRVESMGSGLARACCCR